MKFGLFRHGRPTGRYYTLLGLAAIPVIFIWVLPHMAANDPGVSVVPPEWRRVIDVSVMLVIIGVLFLVGMSSDRDWNVGFGNARRIAGVGGRS